MFFYLFNPPPSNISIRRDAKPWTLDTLVEGVRTFPDATSLILASRAKVGITPDQIKRIVFCFLVKGILGLNYHESIKKAVFSLTHSTENPREFKINEDVHWQGLQIK